MSGFGWPDYLDLAKRLSAQTGDEAALRSAISRAYYAAYGMAHGRLVQHRCLLSGSNLHRQVWRAYQGSDDGACRRVGALGFLLCDRRNAADYSNPVAFAVDLEVLTCLAFPDELLRLLDSLDPKESCCR